MTLLDLLSLAAGAALLGLALRTDLARRRAPRLPAPVAGAADVTVLLPVRDEEQNALPCVDALLAQTVQPRVRVIDDASTDRTVELLESRLPGFPRLSLLSAGPLPAGWRGKVHALATGIEGVESPWVLSTDADARLHPEALGRALAAALDRRLDGLSIGGRQEARGLTENLLIPPVFALLDFLLGDWGRAADGGTRVASGQFILFRRAALEDGGGFAPLRTETLDDVALFARFQEASYRTGFFRAPDLLAVRMYRGAREVTRGWRRILAVYLGRRPGVVAAALLVLLLPPAAGLAELAAGRPLPAALLWATGVAAGLLCRASGRQTLAYSLLYPLDALLLAGVLALAVVDRRRKRLTRWKGREIEI
ncbi:MAG TPA: glycosyltransferase [Thermoanaerobaculia bacterium]|nr:glycosyltransferase [Thermoanaerobaculia bacterium]